MARRAKQLTTTIPQEMLTWSTRGGNSAGLGDIGQGVSQVGSTTLVETAILVGPATLVETAIPWSRHW